MQKRWERDPWQEPKSWSGWGVDSKQLEAKKEHEVIIYLDYNGVLNEWPNAESVKTFLESLKLMAPNVKLRLISYGGSERIEQTMFEVVTAGIHSHFDHIVFTKDRTSVDRKRALGDKWSIVKPKRLDKEYSPWPERRIYPDDPLKPYSAEEFAQWAAANGQTFQEMLKMWERSAEWKVKYFRYYGGKDDYIAEQYGKECNQKSQRIVFVDDRIGTVNCVEQLSRGHQGRAVPVTAVVFRRDPRSTYDYLFREIQRHVQDSK